MTKRKFTPPTKYPAKYTTPSGSRAIVVSAGINDKQYYIGFLEGGSLASWDKKGYCQQPDPSLYDLCDIPKVQVHWAIDYGDTMSGWTDDPIEVQYWCRGIEGVEVIRREKMCGGGTKYCKEYEF